MENVPVCTLQEAADLLARAATREGILRVEEYMRAKGGSEELDMRFPLVHRFANGVYAREIFLPKGSLVIGKIHRHGHLNVISKGHVVVGTEFGVEELSAPHTFISKPGTKRMVYALEDTIWTTFHGTESTDVEQIEGQIICKSFAEFDQIQAELNRVLEDKS